MQKIKLVKSKSISYLKLPFDFFENHFRKMNPDTIKFYLYILYLCTLGDVELDDFEIAKRLDLSGEDIKKAYIELREAGLLKINEETGEHELINPDEYYKNLQKISNSELKKETKDIIRTLEFDDNFKNIFDFFESLFGKSLNHNEMLEIYDLLNNQKVPFEVLACAASYSVSKGKKSINYIAKIAINWKELGLTSYESCEKYISNENIETDTQLSKDNLYFQIKKLFNVQRELYEVEKDYIDNWYYTLGKDINDIKKALELTIINTGKLSFPYINKILINGFSKNEIPAKKEKKGLNNFTERDYDYDNIVNALRKKQNG